MYGHHSLLQHLHVFCVHVYMITVTQGHWVEATEEQVQGRFFLCCSKVRISDLTLFALSPASSRSTANDILIPPVVSGIFL